jgi:hypothetical protein
MDVDTEDGITDADELVLMLTPLLLLLLFPGDESRSEPVLDRDLDVDVASVSSMLSAEVRFGFSKERVCGCSVASSPWRLL